MTLVQQEHCYAKSLASDFQIQVNKFVHKIKCLSKKFKIGGIFGHINNWKRLKLLETVRGAHIEIEDLESVPLAALQGKNFLDSKKKQNFVLNGN